MRMTSGETLTPEAVSIANLVGGVWGAFRRVKGFLGGHGSLVQFYGSTVSYFLLL